MPEKFDPALIADLDFKEDAVREVIIAPMLSRLGYHPTGKQAVPVAKVWFSRLSTLAPEDILS